MESPGTPVVVTLVHGTILFARWPRVLRLLEALARVWSRGDREPAWYEDGSPFVTRLAASLGSAGHITRHPWSGGNSVWERIWAAGAEGDFGMRATPGRPLSLRDRIAAHERDYPGARQVLVAHSHGGNVCLYALRDAATRRAVSGLVCLSTPFVHARERPDAGTLTGMLKAAGALLYLMLFFGVSQWVSARLPEPWDAVVFVSGFTVALIAAAFFWARSESRRHALRAWAESMNEPALDRPSTLVLLSDGDEALLALKIAEGLNVMARGLWRAAFWLPSLVHAQLGRLGRWHLGLYGVLSLAALVFFLLRDGQSPWGPNPGQTWSILLALKFLAAAALVPLMLYVVSALALAAPAIAAMLIGYPALTFSRWLAFGWGGSVGMEITAETCPLGTATITRLGTQPDARGLRHAHSYNHAGAPGIVAEFVARVAGAGDPVV